MHALWVIGDGPERARLAQLARSLDVEESVTFLGAVDHAGFKGALQASCQAFVLPTLQDLIGRIAVEALTTGTPVVVYPMTGAAGTIVRDGVNGIVVDPRDTRALAAAMHRTVDPATSSALREGVRRTNAVLFPDAAASTVPQTVALARSRGGWSATTAVDFGPHYSSQGADWMVLPVKLMSRTVRSAPLSDATPVGCPPSPVAQIRLSRAW